MRGRRLVSPRPLLHVVCLAGAVAASAGAHYALQQRLPPDHVAFLVRPYQMGVEAGQATVDGVVRTAPERRPHGIRLQVDATRVITPAGTLGVTGRVQLSVYRPRADTVRRPALAVGDRIRVAARLEGRPHPRNPADFDYGRYLARRGLHVLMAAEASDVDVLHRARRTARIERARRYVRTVVDRYVPAPEGRAVLRALLLADRSGIDPQMREAFVRTGLMHLLAVSGLHVLLVGWVSYQLLRPLLARAGTPWAVAEGIRAASTIALLVGYLMLTGAPASVSRAVIMATLLIGGAVLQRSSHTLNTLGVAALVLLALRPAQLFDVGFQLSFAAVGALVTLTPRLDAWWEAAGRRYAGPRWLTRSVTTSLAASLGTAPVLLYHFGYASFAGLALNVVAIPCTALALAAGLLTAALGWLGPAGAVFGAAAAFFVDVLASVASWGEGVLGWSAVRYRGGPWTVVGLTALLVALAQGPRPRLRWRFVLLALVAANAGGWTAVLADEDHRLEVLFFDVGQGDAALVRFPSGRHLLIDAGPRTPFTDQGARTILPHLRAHGIGRLDAVLVTHPDADHLGGLPALLRGIPVGRVLHNGDSSSSSLFRETAHLVDSLDLSHRVVQAGDTLSFDPQVRAHVLWPDPTRRGRSANEGSVVLWLGFGRTSFLFAGDVEREAERELVARYGTLLASDVTTIPHHGSGTSSTPGFVASVVGGERTTTRFALVSVSRRNPFGLPVPEVLHRWQKHGAEVTSTAVEGARRITSDGRDVRLSR